MAGYITVLIQKSNPEGDWGFKMGSSSQRTCVVITQIDPNCVAAELLEAGDRIIEIEGMDTNQFTQDELQAVLGNPSKRLSMVVLKKNKPKDPTSIRRVTTQKVSEIEETREEEEKRKEYEVVLEVSPRSSLDDALRAVKEKLDRGEQLDEKEMKIVSSYNKKVQQSSTKYDATKRTTEKGTLRRGPMFGPLRNTEIQKRREKFLKEQMKEESLTIQEVTTKKDVETMEEKKKKASSFWTDPPSDLKKIIEKNQFWQKNQSNEPVSTSAIFSHLNDLRNEQRKTAAQEEKRQFWENCRKKYGWDPPESKYDLSHRLKLQDDFARSRSCEPEHLASNKAVRGQGYRETNPFYAPAPTNPFYDECRTHSDEHLTRNYSGQDIQSTKPMSTQEMKESLGTISSKQSEKIEEFLKKENIEKRSVSSEANKEDFASKCEFFERATSVPTTSFVKNAQDIVSEHLGTSGNTNLKKPSDFINEMKSEQSRARLSRSSSKEETTDETKIINELQKQRSASLSEPQQSVQSIQICSEEMSSSLHEQSTSTLQSGAIRPHKIEGLNDSTKFKQAEALEKSVIQECERQEAQSAQITQQKELKETKNTEASFSESFKKNVDVMEAEMNESIEKIKCESEKLRSLSSGSSEKTEAISIASTQGVSFQKTDIPANIIPDTKGLSISKMTTSVSGEFQKRSFVETSYEKVTKTGTPFENVESAWRREFRVATPSGFYDNNTEEVFKQEARTEGLREVTDLKAVAEDYVDQAFREITRMEGPLPMYEAICEYKTELAKESRESSGSVIHTGPK